MCRKCVDLLSIDAKIIQTNRYFFASVAFAQLCSVVAVPVAASSELAPGNGEWFQGSCSKCDYKTSKQKIFSDPADLSMECFKRVNGEKCGGLVVYKPCSPPG